MTETERVKSVLVELVFNQQTGMVITDEFDMNKCKSIYNFYARLVSFITCNMEAFV